MHRFGEQIEFRIDRRQILLLFLGGLFWTMLSFFLGMMAAGPSHVQKNLSALGWWEHSPKYNSRVGRTVVQGQSTVGFQEMKPNPPTKRRYKRLQHKNVRQVASRKSERLERRSRSLSRQPEPVRRAPPVRRPRRKRKVPPRKRRYQRQPSRRSRPRRRRRAPRTRMARREVPRNDTLSLLRDARRFSKGGSRRSKPRRSQRSIRSPQRTCQIRVSPSRGRYVIRLRAPSSLSGKKRLRSRLRRKGFGVRISRVGRRYRLELGRFSQRRNAIRCLRYLQQKTSAAAGIASL